MSRFALWVATLALCLARVCQGGEADPPRSEYFADQLAAEVRQTPTDSQNLSVRLHCLMNTARLLLPEVGPQNLDQVLTPQRMQDILSSAERNEADFRDVDQCLLGLCALARDHQVLPNLQRVSFRSRSGATVVAYLFVPKEPSDRALVFGHGGFGSKESWLDLMQKVTEKTGCYTLTMDFEGCGESTGYSTWSGRINDFSAAMDFLQERYSIRRFAAGGHSGGGAYPAACSALEDSRVSVLVLWDCIFDFYDTHLTPSAPDPGGNPAALLENALLSTRDRRVVPAEVAPARKIAEHLEEIYQDVDTTLGHFRHPAVMLAQAQKTRKLAILHVTAEDVLRQVGPERLGQTFTLPQDPGAGPTRARFLGRPLDFFGSGLFNRPQGMWDGWKRDLGEPTRFVVIPKTTHGFELPGRAQATDETVAWIGRYLGPEQARTGGR